MIFWPSWVRPISVMSSLTRSSEKNGVGEPVTPDVVLP